MRRNLLTIIILIALFSACNNPKTDSTAQDSSSVRVIGDKERWNPMLEVEDSTILLSGTYRFTPKEHLKSLLTSRNWKEIYKQDDHYMVGTAQYTLSTVEEDPCSGLPAQEIVSHRNALLMFSIANVTEGKLDTVAFSESIIYPGKPWTFTFNGSAYTLEAEGITFYSEDGHNPEGHYTLKLFAEAYPEGITLIHQSQYDDTCTEIVMITDLDKDGFPDFILSSPQHYEIERYLIILSSENKMYEGRRNFDC